MSILSRTINEVDKQSAKKKQTMYDLEKTIREMAKSKGMQPRNFLIKACEMSDKLAKNPVIKALIGEYDVPTQKGRDAKPEVLTKRAMNTVKKSIKHSANKQRRRDSKSAITKGVDESGILYRAGVKKYGKDGMKAIQSAAGKGANHQEIGKIKDKHLKDDMDSDLGYAQMILKQNPQEYAKMKQTGDLMDAPTIYDKLFQYFAFDPSADDQMPYGTAKARDGDPYVWIADKLAELGLDEGNEFAQKVRQLKATGAKKGTKFKTSDGQEHTLEDLYAQTIDFMAELEQKIKEEPEFRGPRTKLPPKVLANALSDVMDHVRQVNNEAIKKAKRDGTQAYEVVQVSDDVMEFEEDYVYYVNGSEEQSVSESYEQEAEQKMTAKDAKLKALQDIQMDRHTDKDKELVRKLIQRKKELMKKESVTLEEMVNIPITEEEFEKLAEKKDACYHKVKARYKVWPSAYASGALVQCRKKGAANWGNKSKK